MESDIIDEDYVYSDDSEVLDVTPGTDRLYFQDNVRIYIRKTQKTFLSKDGLLKQSNRVYKSKHSCLICKKLIAKPVAHLEEVHANDERILKLKDNPD